MSTAELDAQSIGIDGTAGQPCVFHRHRGGRDSQLDVARHDLDEFTIIDVVLRIEIANLGSQAGRETGRRKRERTNTAPTIDEI